MYKYYNPHPKGLSTDDCVKRAIVVVTGMDYSKVQRELNEYKTVTGAKSFNSVKNLRYVEDILKAKKISLDVEMIVDEFCKKYPKGRYILDMDEHWSACVDGCIYDTWDCSDEKVNFAYEVTTEPYSAPDLKKQVFKNCCTSERISDTETRIRIFDGNRAFTERKIPTELTEGYVLCLQHSNYSYIDLDGGERK
ncbi:MAG: hypothetical protein IJX58_04010 [Clostridia bacterium]|nr:hypothetical protein [Clostridia bacterium]